MSDKKLECFGTANMSDACCQCKDNEACSEETIRCCKAPEMSGISEKAKTTREIKGEIIAAKCQWKDLTLEKRLEKQKWVRLEVHQQEIDDCKASWQNLKDTIPKFDAKISYLETHLKACNKLIDEMQRERGLQKQKLQRIIEMAQRYSKEGMDFAGYDRIAEELEELLK